MKIRIHSFLNRLKASISFIVFLFILKASVAQTNPYVSISPKSNAYGAKITGASVVKTNKKATGVTITIKNTSQKMVNELYYKIDHYDSRRQPVADTSVSCDPNIGPVKYVVKQWLSVPKIDQNGDVIGKDSFPSLEDEEAMRRDAEQNAYFKPGNSNKITLNYWPPRAAYAIVTVRSVNVEGTTYYSSGF